jgi:hypothetical protein
MNMTGRFWIILVSAPACAWSLLGQERFDSADTAAKALLAAVESHDSDKVSAIFGPRAAGILTSGNATQDREEQTEFARLAQSKHRLEVSRLNPNRVVLAIGEEDWPFPVPIVKTNGGWSFDVSETRAEIRARRIGADELDAIEICHGYVEAQRKYAAEDRDNDGLLEYAPRLMSTPGHQDGLYWQGASEPLIPASLAQAEWLGLQKGQTIPYHGYYFRILNAQGPNAPGGAHNYLAKGKLIGGFAIVAWPAEYGVTGVHTFIVNQDDVVYEKDIPPASGQAAPAIIRYDPDRSWQPVD